MALREQKCAISNVQPLVDLENHDLIRKLYSLFHGSIEEVSDAARKVLPASLVLRLRILSCFIRSIRAANSFPLTVKTTFECLYTQATNARLKLAGMEYTIWTLQHACQEQLESMGPLVLSGLVKFLYQHQLTKYDKSSVRMRQFSYEGISELGKRLPKVISKDVSIVSELLRMLSAEDDQVKVSAMEAMRLLSSAYSSTGREVKAKLEQMLTLMATSPDKSLRLLAIQWAASVFQMEEIHGLHLCIISTADESLEVAEEAGKLLNWKLLKDKAKKGAIGTDKLVEYLLGKNPELRALTTAGSRTTKKDVLKNMIRSVRHTRMGEIERDPGMKSSYAPLVESALPRTQDTDLLVEAISAMLIEANVDPKAFQTQYAHCKGELRTLLGHANEKVRKGAARLAGLIFAALPGGETTETLAQILDETLGLEVKKHLEKMQASLLCVGYTLGHALLSGSTVEPKVVEKFFQGIGNLSDTSNLSFPLNAVLAENTGIVQLCRAPQGTASPSSALFEERVAGSVKMLKDLTASPIPKTVSSAVVALGQASACSPQELVRDVSTFLLDLVPKAKEETVAFALGEAFSFIFGSTSTSRMREMLLFTDALMDESLKPLIYAEEEASQGAFGEDRIQLCGEILESLLQKDVSHSDPNVRRNASIILLSVIKSMKAHPSISMKVLEIQSAFCELVKDTNEITQEISGQGISLIYSISEGDMKKRLVDNLVDVLITGRLKPKKQKISEESVMFEGDVLGKDPQGKKISTYKHLCSIANDIGQPDVVYKFIQLANHNSLLKAEKGAAMSLASLSNIAAEELAPILPQILPKLYRLLHDPNPSVQESMNMLWCSLVDDPRSTLALHFNHIMEELLHQLGSNLWRNRQSAAAALSDLIQGRTWRELQPFFERVWVGVFRVIDDIKETVRIAAMTLASSLQRTTARLCEDVVTHEETSPAEVAFPTLLTKGITSPVKEVKSISLKVLYHLTKFSDDRLLHRYVTMIASSLLEGLSGLESASMNYIQQHATAMGIDREKIEDLRIKAANQSMVGDMLDRISRHVDKENLAELSGKLSDLLRNGFGTNTRAGAARFLSSVTLRQRFEMKMVSSKLLKALTSPLNGDSNPAICRLYASTFAQLAKFSEPRHVDTRFSRILEAVRDEDTNLQRAGAIYCLELCRQAPDVFGRYATDILPVAFCVMQGAKKEHKDKQKDQGSSSSSSSGKAASIFESIWDEAAPCDSAAMRMYHKDIGDLCLAGLSAQKWHTRKAIAIAIRELVRRSNGPVSNAGDLCKALIAALPGRYWEGKETVMATVGEVYSKNLQVVREEAGLEDEIAEAVLARVRSERKEKMVTSLLDLVKVLGKKLGENFLSRVRSLLETRVSEAEAAEDEEDGISSEVRATIRKFIDRKLS